jgi:hypothetical protein
VQLEVAVEFADSTLKPDAVVLIALFENDLVSRVDAGENRGETLQHDYVVRKLIGPLKPNGTGLTSTYTLELPLPPEVDPGNAGLAVVVQNERDGSVLQALATPLLDTVAVTP